MIATKIARIVAGDPRNADHWHGIVGYARLSALAAQPPGGSEDTS
jgi:hypothetical protein